ncbi:hypothetical protein [Bacillus thuringiensis phage MZTP02]|uniref:Uncharacterized protein n=1 Tax=Bacillus thuringiensis phage MZTP02 TaxID=311221 RepID=Q58QF2_9CAUD|nr:hypothetical protein [Bacillus thuringiensis phage MZTP02]
MRVVIIQIHGISIMVGCGLLGPEMYGRLIFQNFFLEQKKMIQNALRDGLIKTISIWKKQLKYRLVSCSGRMFHQ